MTPSAVCASDVYFAPCRSTGKERDAESGNDYFGARYYASTMGRFLSPDWSAKIMPVPYAKMGDPQTLNLYAYVGNNPLTRFDPDGHEVDLNGPQKDKAEEQKRILSNLKPSERGLFASSTDKNGKTTLTLNKTLRAISKASTRLPTTF